MRLLRKKTAQSMIEYAILLAVVISAFLLLQAIIKRGVSGGLNEAAGRFGDQYSVTNTASIDKRVANADQVIMEETGTDTNINAFLGGAGPSIGTGELQHAYDKSAYNVTTRKGQDITSETRAETDFAKGEAYRFSDSDDDWAEDFSLTYPIVRPTN